MKKPNLLLIAFCFSAFLFFNLISSYGQHKPKNQDQDNFRTTKYVHPDGNDNWTGISIFEDWDGDGNYDDGPYRTIQHAVDEAWPDYVIKVADKADLDPDYTPDAPIQLWHEDHEGVTIEWWTEGERPQVRGANAFSVFLITVPDVTIEGFDIYTPTGFDGPGIKVTDDSDSQGDNCTISNNRCGYDATHRCNYGIEVNTVSNVTIIDNVCSFNEIHGIYFWNYTGQNTIEDNVANYNASCGIYVRDSDDNNIHDNTCNYNDDSGDKTGMYFKNSDDNSIYSNTCDENTTGIYMTGCVNNTLSGNITSDNYGSGISLSSCSDNFIMGSTSEDNSSNGIYLENSVNNILYNNYCNRNYDDGIHLNTDSESNSLSGNTCTYNAYYGLHIYNADYNCVSGNDLNTNDDEGVFLDASFNNLIIGNNISDNGGLVLEHPQITIQNSSDNNEIYLNTFDWMDNPVNSSGSSNSWYSPVELTYLYDNLVDDHKINMGNYYSDYNGSDDGSSGRTADDGIGDTDIPYTTDNAGDNYPLIELGIDDYDFKTWWLGTSTEMFTGDVTKMGQLIFVNAGSAYSWFDQNATDIAIAFGNDGSKTDNDWSGQIAFQTAPAVGDNFTIKIGYANDDAGTGFTYGPQATINGDGSTKIFTFTTDDTYLSVPENKHIGVKLENDGSTRYYVRVGASWSYVASAYPITYPGTEISAQSGDWDNSEIWGNNAVPTSDDDVIVQDGHTVTVNSTADCQELKLHSSSSLTVNSSIPGVTTGYDFNSNSTVEYSKSGTRSGDQTISSDPVYGNLTISGTGTKTTDGDLQVNGYLSIQGDATFSLGGNLDANSNITIGSGATFNPGSYNVNIAGNWSKSGTWNYSTSTVIFDGSGSEQSIGPSSGSGEIEVGTGNEDIDDYPFNNYWENNKTQMLYLSGEIGNSGDINGIQFNLNNVSDPDYRDFANFTVKLKETSESNWYNKGSYADMTGATTVFSQNPYNMPGSTGWFTISFDTPFTYSGSDNLIVEICWGDNGEYTSNSYELWGTDYPSGTERVLYGKSDYQTPPDFDYESDKLPNIKFNFSGSAGTKEFYNLTAGQSGTGASVSSSENIQVNNNLNVQSGTLDFSENITVTNNLSVGTAAGSSATLEMEPDKVLTVSGDVDINNSGEILLKDTESTDTKTAKFVPAQQVSTSGSGSCRIQKYYNGEDWHLISPPVSDATANVFYGHYLQYHTESDNSWTDIVDENYALQSMHGYSLWSTEAGYYLFEFDGTPNAENQTYDFVYGGGTPIGDYGWNMIGNPYTTAIDWTEVTIPANLDGAIYRFDPTIGDNGEYVYYLEGSGSNTSDQYIAMTQGFFVHCNNAAGGTLTITPDAMTSEDATFYKSNEPTNNALVISVNGFAASKSEIRFIEDAGSDFDGKYDVYRLFSASSNLPYIYSGSAEARLAVNTLPSIEENQVIPVGFKAGVNGTYTLDFSGTNTFETAVPVFFKDKKQNTCIDLRKNTEYTFNYDKNDEEFRFEVLFKDQTGIENYQQSPFLVYTTGKDIFIQVNAEEETYIELYNLSGQLIRKKVTQNANTSFRIETPGFYLIRIHTEDKVIKHKVIVN